MGKFRLAINQANNKWNVDVYEGRICIFHFVNCENESKARDVGRAFIDGIFHARGI